jgi:hypothetical protein
VAAVIALHQTQRFELRQLVTQRGSRRRGRASCARSGNRHTSRSA